MKGIKKAFTCEVKGVADKARTLRFTATNATEDRTGEVVDPAGMDATNFLKNAIVPFAHDYKRLPVGRALSLTMADGNVDAEIEFVPAEVDPFAEKVYQLCKRGFLKGVSIGFLPKQRVQEQVDEKGNVVKAGGKPEGQVRSRVRHAKWELLEISVVPIPANPTALQNAVAAGVIDEAESKSLAELGVALVALAQAESPDEYEVPAEALAALHRPLTVDDFLAAVKLLPGAVAAPVPAEAKAGVLQGAADALGEATEEQKKIGTAFPKPEGGCPDKSKASKDGKYCIWVRGDGVTPLDEKETVDWLATDEGKALAAVTIKVIPVKAPIEGVKDYPISPVTGDVQRTARAAQRSDRSVRALENHHATAEKALGKAGMADENNRAMVASTLSRAVDSAGWAMGDYADSVGALHAAAGQRAAKPPADVAVAAADAHDGYRVAQMMLEHKLTNAKSMADVKDAHGMISKAARSAHDGLAAAHAQAPYPAKAADASADQSTMTFQELEAKLAQHEANVLLEIDAVIKKLEPIIQATLKVTPDAGGTQPKPEVKGYDAGELLRMGETVAAMTKTLQAFKPARA